MSFILTRDLRPGMLLLDGNRFNEISTQLLAMVVSITFHHDRDDACTVTMLRLVTIVVEQRVKSELELYEIVSRDDKNWRVTRIIHPTTSVDMGEKDDTELIGDLQHDDLRH